MRSYPNLRHVRLIDAAVRLGSLTQAADHVGISQPAGSQALVRLEDLFGGRLLERTATRAVATPRGEVVARRAARALALLKAAASKIARLEKARPAKPVLLEAQAAMPQLRAISAFAETGSFSAAARRLGLSEPSVNRAARDLEQIAGEALFAGTSRHLMLTPAGRLLSRHANLVMKELDSAFEEVRELAGAFDGRVVVGTLPLVRTAIVPAAVVSLADRRPDATVEVLDGPYDTLVQDLENGRIDMLVGALRPDLPRRDLVEETLFQDDLSIVARADHPLARRRSVTPADLAGFPWVLPRPGTPTRASFDRLAATFPPDASLAGVIETGSLVALRSILMMSDRLTILSRRQILYEEEAGYLTVLQYRLSDTTRPIGLTLRSGWQPTALQADFLAELRRVVAEEHEGAE